MAAACGWRQMAGRHLEELSARVAGDDRRAPRRRLLAAAWDWHQGDVGRRGGGGGPRVRRRVACCRDGAPRVQLVPVRHADGPAPSLAGSQSRGGARRYSAGRAEGLPAWGCARRGAGSTVHTRGGPTDAAGGTARIPLAHRESVSTRKSGAREKRRFPETSSTRVPAAPWWERSPPARRRAFASAHGIRPSCRAARPRRNQLLNRYGARAAWRPTRRGSGRRYVETAG